MAVSGPKKACSYEIIDEGEERVMVVSCGGCNYSPSIEDNPLCMARTVEKLIEAGPVTKIVFSEKREYEYDEKQTRVLLEIARLYKSLAKQKSLFSYYALGVEGCTRCLNLRYNEINNEILPMIKSDPIGAYVIIKRSLRRERINFEKALDKRCAECIKKYIAVLNYLQRLLEQTQLISMAKPYLSAYRVGDRSAYRNIFYPTIKPDFMFTKLMTNYPSDGEEIDNYSIGDTDITIFKFPDKVQYLYHVVPPEFKLEEEHYELLDTARKIMAEHKPKKEEFTDPEHMRQVFYNVGHDLLEELAEHRKIILSQEQLNSLASILVRYTIGFGLIEVLLQDPKIQDVNINSPIGSVPMFIVHADWDDCVTNIIPTKNEAESWASKLRMISGRPLDEADPVLDTELQLPGASTRVSVISKPLNPTGLAYSFRRHRDKPWTLPLFIKQKMITPLAAGMLSFMVDGTRTMLIAGTRSAGKSSLLASILVEIMRRYRIITIEDTLELPSPQLRKLGFNIQSMKVSSALSTKSTEVSAEDGIRSTLRLGDSALIVGEVRSKEAKALYEAMRVGAAANVVAGTIHGDSPYGVYDRVVNDIGVPKTSFKATDVVIVANPVRSADGIHKYRRVTQITEIRKHWENDPLEEGGFVDLMKYDAKADALVETDDVINGDSDILKSIAANIREFAGNWDALWENIVLRGKIKEAIVSYSEKLNSPRLLEAPFVIKCNDMFHLISDKVKEEAGSMDPKRIFYEFDEWLKRELRKQSYKD